VPSATASSEQFQGMDAELLANADRISREVEADEASAMHRESPAQKRTALTSESTSESLEQDHDRAARFFAVHGMADVGRMLGEELSATAEQQALRDAEKARNLLNKAAEVSPVAARHGMSGTALRGPAAPSSGAGFGFDLDDEEDQESAAYRLRWKAVDKLRHHMPPM